jgi:hypothetical protein
MASGQRQRDAHARLTEGIEHDDEVPFSSFSAAELAQLVLALIGGQELAEPSIGGCPVPSPSAVGAGLHHYLALGAGFRLDRVDRLDPQRSEPRDERIVVVADVVGVAPPAGFQLFQEPAQLAGLDGTDPGVGSEPDQPEGLGVGNGDR